MYVINNSIDIHSLSYKNGNTDFDNLVNYLNINTFNYVIAIIKLENNK